MQRIRKYLFKFIYFGILILLIVSFFYFNKEYFIDLTSTKEILSSKHKMMFYFARGVLGGAIIFMILFRKFIYLKRRELGVLLFSLVVVFAVLEVGSRVYICNTSNSGLQSEILLYGQCGENSMYEPHLYLDYRGTQGYESSDGLNKHNSRGFRGEEIEMPKPKEVFRIATVGGSTTYTTGVKDWRKDFARQLEKELTSRGYENVKVINAGLGGWNSWESLINLQFNVLDFEPDLVIVYHGANDIHARIVNPTSYKSDNSGMRKQWQEPKIPLIFRLTFVRLITRTNPISISDFVDADTATGGVEYSGFMKSLNDTSLGALEKNPPIYYERNLRNMVAIAREHGSEIMLSTFAHINQGIAATPQYEQGFRENNEVVLKVGGVADTNVYDFASEMPSDKIYWSDGMHLNEKGVELKAKLFADFIEEEGLMNEI